MVNPWIEHVKKFASKKGISYTQALKHADVKKGYKAKAKGGAVYGAPDSPSPPTEKLLKFTFDDDDDDEKEFTMGKPDSKKPRRRSSSKASTATTNAPQLPRFTFPQRMTSETEVAEFGRRPSMNVPFKFPARLASPSGRLSAQQVERRANNLISYIEDKQTENVLTETFANRTIGEIEKLFADASKTLKQKNDGMSKILDKIMFSIRGNEEGKTDSR